MMITSVVLAVLAGVECQSGRAVSTAVAGPASRPAAADDLFHAPVRVLGGGEPVRVDAPGWAAPCWADVDGDGDADLLVGQFDGGKIRVYENDGAGVLGAGRWLEAGGEVAMVPGVW